MAIVGGGCAGIAAAWHLSQQPGYEISVYERSWRLGGKGASGRTDDGRIVEHGLHVWLGFYENAFRMIRECYAEVQERDWGPHQSAPAGRLAHATFEDAFFPEPQIGVSGVNDGTQVVWSGLLPPEPGLPGDDLVAETNPFTVASYLQRCAHLLKALMLSVVGTAKDDVPGKPRPDQRSAIDERIDLDFSLDPSESPELLIESVATRVRTGALTLAAGVLQAVTIFEHVVQDLNHSPQAAGSVLNVLRALAGQARKQFRDIVAIDPELRWKTEIIDIVMTIAVGLYRDRVLLGSRGLDALNGLDYRDWLRKHGATNSSLDSRFITGIYDLVFAYEGGNRSRPRLAAGVALRGALRMFFTYRGSMFWRMRSGMGDAVFAPLYKVLSGHGDESGRAAPSRPVKFHFLHELTDLRIEKDEQGRSFVTEFTFGPASSTDGRHLHRVDNPGDAALDHFGCWPDAPDQLLRCAGSTAPVTKRVGKDFDAVVLALGLEDFAALIPAKPVVTDESATDEESRDRVPGPWRAAIASPRQTVATKAAQVWFSKNLEQLGWFRGSAIVSALGHPYPPPDPYAPESPRRQPTETDFDTWADMTHTIPSERAWRRAGSGKRVAQDEPATTTRSVAYFCGVMPDTLKNRRPGETVTGSLAALLKRIRHLWPEFPPGKEEIEEIAGVIYTHHQENTRSVDRYSQSLPGRIASRLSPLDRSVLNATVAGDWTACGLDAGCIEAAVMSGMLAAHAITGRWPTLESITGYDHP